MLMERVILLLAGVVVAYFAIYFGDGLYAALVTDFALPKTELGLLIIPALIFGLILAVVGLIGWTAAMTCALSRYPMEDQENVTVYAVIGLICLSCVFGIVAGPFTNYGAYPWYWTSRWDWLPILALVPSILVARGLLTEAIVARRNQKKSKNDVPPTHRDTA